MTVSSGHASIYAKKGGSVGSVNPALTAEEWKQGFAWIGPHMVLAERTDTHRNVGGFDIRLNVGGGNLDRAVANFTPEQARAIAALALYGQPFGFTREHVKLLRAAATACRNDDHYIARELDRDEWEAGRDEELAQMYDTLADLIESFLPPKK